jgi:signal transduction histidine kinase
MKRYSSYLHDLNNKLTIIYGALRSYKIGKTPSEEKIDAVKARIQEIIQALNSEFQFEEEHRTEFLNLSFVELRETLHLMIEKIRSIYLGTSLSFNDVNGDSIFNQFIKIEKNLLYQILENAIENSVNASSSSVQISLIQEIHSIKIEIKDNGTGFKENSQLEETVVKTCGIGIIKENMRMMDGEAAYFTNNPQGVTLTLLFKSI